MPLQLRWSVDGDDDCLVIAGVDASALDGIADDDLGRVLPVYTRELVGGGSDAAAPLDRSAPRPMAGRYRRDPGNREVVVRFAPRHPFLAGREYCVVPPGAAGPRATDGPAPAGRGAVCITRPGPVGPPTTTVVAIRPAVEVVPRNLLRCYVEFSAPMRDGDAATHVAVRDGATGEVQAGALLDADPELWSGDRTRLTVLFDPARLKRGLAPHREAGYPLREGAEVELVVDAAFRDAAGRPLVEGATRRYRVGPDVRARVDPSTWRLAPPAAGTRGPLRVWFDRPLDHALLARTLRVVEPDGPRVPCAAAHDDGGRAWTFAPLRPWARGPHELAVDPALEDVCGNSVVRVFDRNLDDPAHDPVDGRRITVEFEPE